MRKIYLILFVVATCTFASKAQVLNVGRLTQEYDQWCWAGSSKTILDYYGFVKQQCEIAEWVRTVATFYDFGKVNCCTDATKGCNYWNYNYSSKGSIQDILVQFGNIQNTGVASALTQANITTEIQNNRLFVIRWGWNAGGGHFIVGHGINGNNIYYMDPWFGEGLKIATYTWVKSDGNHTWTHTNKITSDMTTDTEEHAPVLSNNISASPNPFQNSTDISYALITEEDVQVRIFNMYGQLVYENNIGKQLSGQHKFIWGGRDNSSTETSLGIYFVQLISGNNFIKTIRVVKAE